MAGRSRLAKFWENQWQIAGRCLLDIPQNSIWVEKCEYFFKKYQDFRFDWKQLFFRVSQLENLWTQKGTLPVRCLLFHIHCLLAQFINSFIQKNKRESVHWKMQVSLHFILLFVINFYSKFCVEFLFTSMKYIQKNNIQEEKR